MIGRERDLAASTLEAAAEDLRLLDRGCSHEYADWLDARAKRIRDRADCPRLGDLVCTRTDMHDPDAVGGHTYAASGAPDKHDASEDAAERSRA